MNITLKDLLDAGVHFGHQVRRWNPKSKEFVYDHRHGVSIIDLEKTYAQLEKACDFVEKLVASGKDILLVGTKRQAQDVIREAAATVNMPFCANRWMGGALTNWVTVSASLAKYKRYLAMEADGSLQKLPGKEAAAIRREMSRMHRNFEGMQDLKGIPAALLVIDVKTEQIAVAEAARLNLPVIALVDTNSDPSLVSHPIPGNDDAVKSIRVIVETLLEAIQNGLAQRQIEKAPQRSITPIVEHEFSEVQPEVHIDPSLMESAEKPAAEESQGQGEDAAATTAEPEKSSSAS